MNYIRKISFLLLTTFSLMGFKDSTDWYSFESVSGRFSIEFPQKPDTSSQVMKSPIGQLTMYLVIYEPKETPDDNFAYIVGHTVYPDSVINSEKKSMVDGFFRSAVDGAVSNVKGKLLTEKKIELDGFPGREVTVDFQNGQAVILMKCFLVRNVMYILETISESGKENNTSSSHFYQSFKLKKG